MVSPGPGHATSTRSGDFLIKRYPELLRNFVNTGGSGMKTVSAFPCGRLPQCIHSPTFGGRSGTPGSS
jgi:hypothetical protein